MKLKLNLKLLILTGLQVFIIQGITDSVQAENIKGIVFNSVDNQPIPFVTIIYSNDKKGTLSNIEGWFSVSDSVSFLDFRHIGYHEVRISMKKLLEKGMEVKMNPLEIELPPLAASPRNNRGLQIMKKVVEYRGHNDPDKYNSYQYTSFQKFRLSIAKAAEIPTNNKIGISSRTFGGTPFFESEILSKKKMLQPDHLGEEIISANVSGSGKKPYILLSNQLEDLSVYDEFFTVLNRSYISPVSQFALKKYYFAVTDTFLTGRNDSVFVIRFNPVKKKSPIGLKGVVYINNHGNAVEALTAKSSLNDPRETYFSETEQYDLLPDGKWFPGEKITAIRFGLKKAAKKDSILWHLTSQDEKIVAINQTSLYQREINPPLTKADFSNYGVTISPGLKEDTEEAIRSEQNNILGKTDSISRLTSDSINEANKLAAGKSKLIRFIAEGKIPVGYFNINYTNLFSYNLYEGIKVGMGAETNRRLSRFFTVGGYITYGLKDKSVRYGEWLDIYPKGYYDFRIHFGYRDMNMEFGEPEFLVKKSLLNPEFYRDLLIQNMYSTKRYSVGMELRPFQELNTYLFSDLSDNSARENNEFLAQHTFDPFRLTRVGLLLRYSPGISFIADPDMLIENVQPRTDWYLNAIQGVSLFAGEYLYTKLEFKGKFHFQPYSSAITTIMLRAGYISNNAPMIELFNGYGSYVGKFSLLATNSFTTMRQNEFGANDFTAIHIRHDMGLLFLPSGHKFSPNFVFATNIGIGKLDSYSSEQYGMIDYRKGYYESGLEMNNLLRMDFLSWGLGIYYRYGPYSLSTPAENFAYKFGFYFKL